MRTHVYALIFLLVLGLCAGDAEAGTFEVTEVYFELQPSSETEVTRVLVGAYAKYIGPADSNDHSWDLETKLVTDAATFSGSPYKGTGVWEGRVIHCPALQHGAFGDVENCTPTGAGTSYSGQGIVAIYHQWPPGPEIDKQTNGPKELTCSQTNEKPPGGEETGGGGGGAGSDPTDPDPITPILIDLDRGGIRLSSLAEAVEFDLDADGEVERVAWTELDSGDAWLVLDRDGNGRIDTGRELFGNISPQPPSDSPNGYLALGVFDEPAEGGNLDGRIDAEDDVFGRLQLWSDANRDGISQVWELRSLMAAGVRSLDLDYVSAYRRDQYGNVFRYSSLVRLDRSSTQAADVFLLVAE